MKKKRSAPESQPADPPVVRLAPRWRVLVSVLVLLHLTAVFLAPLNFESSGPETASPYASNLFAWFRPYLDFAFLNHGYAFFAPNPGANHLLRCRLEFADGRPPIERTFPDRRLDFPRLRYHRHFMLSEQLHTMFLPASPPAELTNPAALAAWRSQRAQYVARWRSFEEHLRAKYGASKVTMVRVEHRPFSPGDKLRGMSLEDKSFYVELSETTLPEPMGSPAARDPEALAPEVLDREQIPR